MAITSTSLPRQFFPSTIRHRQSPIRSPILAVIPITNQASPISTTLTVPPITHLSSPIRHHQSSIRSSILAVIPVTNQASPITTTLTVPPITHLASPIRHHQSPIRSPRFRLQDLDWSGDICESGLLGGRCKLWSMTRPLFALLFGRIKKANCLLFSRVLATL